MPLDKDAAYWIELLALQKHPEGGYYRETYRAQTSVYVAPHNTTRDVSTAIYFLLENGDKSHFHRIKSDELWFFHEGVGLEVLVLDETGLNIHTLGRNPEQGQHFHVIVPAGKWFAARLKVPNGYALVSCTVAPGFDFEDFELAQSQDLIHDFPLYKTIIATLCVS